LRSALLGLAELLGEHERVGSIQRYLQHIDSVIECSSFDEQDRAAARQGDPQGLGLTRWLPIPSRAGIDSVAAPAGHA
jgi:hypothetical protein